MFGKGFKIGSKSTDLAAAFFAKGAERVEQRVVDVAGVECHIELGAKLAGGAFGAAQKLEEQSAGTAFKTFCDVGHNGNGSPLHLVLQAEITREFAAGSEIVDDLG